MSLEIKKKNHSWTQRNQKFLLLPYVFYDTFTSYGKLAKKKKKKKKNQGD
jgi:hypothetical protein